jgi:hypothetical protein
MDRLARDSPGFPSLRRGNSRGYGLQANHRCGTGCFPRRRACRESKESFMRFTYGLIFGFSLIVFATLAGAQEAQQAIQVVLGKDGSIKVIDPKTGKELPSIILRGVEKAPFVRVIEGPSAIVNELTVDQRTGQLVRQQPAKDDKELEKTKQELQKAKKEIEKLKQDLKKEPPKAEPKKKVEEEYYELEIVPGPDGQPKVFTLKKVPPQTLDQKVDRVLREITELRKELTEVKKRLEERKGPPAGKGPPEGKRPPFEPRGGWGWGGWGHWEPKKGPGNPDSIRIELEAKKHKELEEILRKHGISPDVLKMIEDKKKAAPKKGPGAKENEPAPTIAPAELERRLDHILSEVEALRKEVKKALAK